MIVGLGTDLVGVARIRSVLANHGERFLERVCTPDEQAYCRAAKDPAERLAARWAAKEAAMKALGTGWTQGIRFTDIALAHDDAGAPRLVLTGAAADHARRRGATRFHVSISHADGFAVAVVILESMSDER